MPTSALKMFEFAGDFRKNGLFCRADVGIAPYAWFSPVYLAHIREALDGFGEIFDRFIRVAVLDAVADAVLDVALEHDLAAAVQRRFGRVELRKNVLAGDVLVDHAVDGLHLTDDFFEPAVQIFRVHALSHCKASIHIGVYLQPL